MGSKTSKKAKYKNPTEYKFQDYWWFWDCRPDPFDKGKPWWKMYEDHKSVAIEVAFKMWEECGKDEDDEKAEEIERVMVSPDYYIDFSNMM